MKAGVGASVGCERKEGVLTFGTCLSIADLSDSRSRGAPTPTCLPASARMKAVVRPLMETSVLHTQCRPSISVQ